MEIVLYFDDQELWVFSSENAHISEANLLKLLISEKHSTFSGGKINSI